MKKLKSQSIILVFITAIIMYLLLKDDFPQIVSTILRMKYIYLIIGIVLIVFYWLIKAIALYLISKEYSKTISFKSIFLQTIITQFFNGVTPFSTGGQPMQIYMLNKSKISLAKSTNIVMQEFITYQVALVLYGIFAVLVNYKLEIFNDAVVLKNLVLLGFLINTSICIVMLILSFSKKMSKTLFNIVFKVLSKLKFIGNLDSKKEKWNNRLVEFQESAELFKKNKLLFAKCFILNGIALTCYYVIPYFLIIGIEGAMLVTPLTAIVASAYTLIIGSFVPIPGGTGGIEYGFLRFFGVFNTGATLSAILLIWRFITYYLGIIVGGVAFSFYKGADLKWE